MKFKHPIVAFEFFIALKLSVVGAAHWEEGGRWGKLPWATELKGPHPKLLKKYIILSFYQICTDFCLFIVAPVTSYWQESFL